MEIARDSKVARGEIVRTARVGKTGYKERGQDASVGALKCVTVLVSRDQGACRSAWT